MHLRRLLPAPGATDVAGAFGDLRLGERAHGDRPWLVVNFVTTLDGRVSAGGRSGPLGGDADREVFHRLRTQVDAVLAGTRTVGVEGYGRLVRDPALREHRVAQGLAPDPLACLVTRSGDLPVEAPLFADPSSTVIAYGAAEMSVPAVAARVETHALPEGEPPLRATLEDLHARYGVRSVLCEGGPTVFSALLAEGVVDELFLTLAPKLVGGGSDPSLTAGVPLPDLAALELVGALEHGGELFLRYELARR